MPAKLQRRLAKIEAQVAERERREKLANCNCHEIAEAVIFDDGSGAGVKRLKEMIDIPCPCHGLRRLDEMRLNIIKFVDPTDVDRPVDPELHRLIAEHKARILEDDRRREKEEG